jgi:hypothetical protein
VSSADARIEEALRQAGYATGRDEVGGREALVGRRADFRLKWFATRLHTFVLVFALGPESGPPEATVAAAQQYAKDHKRGLPPGLQTAVAAVPVFLSTGPRPDLRKWFGAEPRHRFAVLRFPVLAELDSATVTCFRGRMTIGSAYASHLLSVADDVVAPALRGLGS